MGNGHKALQLGLALAVAAGVSGCGMTNPFSRTADPQATAEPDAAPAVRESNLPPEYRGLNEDGTRRDTIWDIFGPQDDPNVTLAVNRYLWKASLDVLDFLPIETIDPFSGVIVTGYGRPPGGGRAYRATIHVSDPALEARSLKLALATQAGPVDPDTVRAVEDAILTRARQLRIAESGL